MTLIASFKLLLDRNAQDCVGLLRQFDAPPVFDLWHNPVTNAALKTGSLAGDSRSMDTDCLHDASDGSRLCDDGYALVDGGITNSGLLWLLYDYHSLTDFSGSDNYTKFRVLRSARFGGDRSLAFTLFYHWLPERSLSRLDFEHDDGWIAENVSAIHHWRIVHTHMLNG